MTTYQSSSHPNQLVHLFSPYTRSLQNQSLFDGLFACLRAGQLGLGAIQLGAFYFCRLW